VATRVLTLLGQVTSALCVECLAEITAVPLSAMRATTTVLFEAGRLIMAPEHPCPLCRERPALMLPGESMRRLFQLIVVRRDRPDTLRSILGTTDRWPPATAVMLDRRVGERRTQSQQATIDLRRGPRRAEPDAMWHTHGFIVVDLAHPSPSRRVMHLVGGVLQGIRRSSAAELTACVSECVSATPRWVSHAGLP
jgi:hypothetical protein